MRHRGCRRLHSYQIVKILKKGTEFHLARAVCRRCGRAKVVVV